MSDDTTTTTVEPEEVQGEEILAPETDPVLSAGDVEQDPDELWRQLIANDGKLPEEDTVTEKPAEVTETVTDAPPEATDALDPRLAELEKAGAEELAKIMGFAPPPAKTETPPPVKPVDAPVITAKPKLPDFIDREDGTRVKLDDELAEIFPEETIPQVKAIFAAIMGGQSAAPASAPAPPPEVADALRQMSELQEELRFQQRVMQVAALNPEVIAINADPQHPFWEFHKGLPEGVKRKAQTGTPKEVATIIGVFQDRQKAALAKQQAETAKAAAKGRKDALYKTPQAARSSAPAATKEMTQEEWNRLPVEEQRRRTRLYLEQGGK